MQSLRSFGVPAWVERYADEQRYPTHWRYLFWLYCAGTLVSLASLPFVLLAALPARPLTAMIATLSLWLGASWASELGLRALSVRARFFVRVKGLEASVFLGARGAGTHALGTVAAAWIHRLAALSASNERPERFLDEQGRTLGRWCGVGALVMLALALIAGFVEGDAASELPKIADAVRGFVSTTK